MTPRRLLPTLSLALLAGCSTAPPGQDWLALPAGLVLASDAGLLKLPVAAAALAFYVVSDPLAPNWIVEEARAADDRYILALRMKAVISGGDGEARQVFTRHAARLAARPGFSGYEELAWQTGIDSGRPFARRVAYGEIRLLRSTDAAARRTP